ncbi:MAG: alpha/beta hydrolase [Burkholderiales bacterium]|uniref:alpha/beta hydrolase family protein n=1 Tax=Nitrosomonas sp. TaxID=42353 RepID=UPI001D91C4E4|nr:alpha/beta hydrolase [Nitrosomonas sp.]MCB1948307.1 alpha/beta hydrolase [Nitrosomonas sp.]MCP5243011.1 alpha/beta hydrolase [Burkholderiales bacterium]
MPPDYFNSPHGTRIAYRYTPGKSERNTLPGVVFLGGFRSDMDGTKACYLEQVCMRNGQAYLRFDYGGHGYSSGTFEDGTIGSWKQDAADIIDHIFGQRDVVLAGSSMGGWIALRLLLERSTHIKGVVGIAAASDFTRDIKNRISLQQQAILERKGYLELPSDYAEVPYTITRALLEDGEQQAVLNKAHTIDVPLVLIHGKQDTDVPWIKACDTAAAFNGPDTRVILIEKAGHRLSEPENLQVIANELANIHRLYRAF